MTGRDDEFDDFLMRRRKLFRPPEEDLLEPPEEVDRIVLRQAREAIETRGGQREIRGLAWGAPLALAATLLLAFTLFMQVGMPRKTPVGEVTVEQVAQRRDYPPAPFASEAAASAPVVQATPPAVANNQPASADQAGAPVVTDKDAATVAKREEARSQSDTASQPAVERQAVANSSSNHEWRRDSRTWLAEIQQLRSASMA